MDKNPNAVALGKLGGAKRSERKAEAARKNGKKGGRPKKRTLGEVIRWAPRRKGRMGQAELKAKTN